jgi:hypothetical protein
VFPTKYIKWYCPINIGMPIRHRTKGVISPLTAATMSATVTNAVGQGMDYELPQGIFCEKFRNGVMAAFTTMYPNLGQIVSRS